MTTDLYASLAQLAAFLLPTWIAFILNGKPFSVRNEPLELVPEHWKVTESIQELLTILWLLCGQYWRFLVLNFQQYLQSRIQNRNTAHNLEEQSTQFSKAELAVLKKYRNKSLAIETLLTHNNDKVGREIRDIVPDLCLLQFAALKGDNSALHCVQNLDPIYGLAKKDALFGAAEKSDWMEQSWEPRVDKHKPGLTFKMERKYWRDGLFLYRTSAVFENCSVHEFKEFILSCPERLRWDWSAEKLFTILPEVKNANTRLDLDSCFIFSENKMPYPFSNREYLVARRVWGLKDGGVFSISRSCDHPKAPKPRGRNVRVKEYTTGFLLKLAFILFLLKTLYFRQVKSAQGGNAPAVEISSLYYDNMKISPVASNLAMSASMWTAIVATDTAFRKFETRSGEVPEVAEIEAPLPRNEERKPRRRRIWISVAMIVVGVLVSKRKKQHDVPLVENKICSDGLDLEREFESRLR